MEKIGFDSGFGVFYTYICDKFGCVISIGKLRRDFKAPISASKSGDKEPEWRFWTSLWRLKYSEAGRKKPGFRFISMNF